MEQAQRDTWFKPAQALRAENRPEGPTGHVHSDSGRTLLAFSSSMGNAQKRVAQARPAATGPVPDRAPGTPAPAVTTAYSLKPEAGNPFGADVRLAGLALALAGVSRLKVAGLKPAADAGEMMAELLHTPAEPALQGEGAVPDPQPVRLHAEWQGQDVTVWLGIDTAAETAEAQLAHLLPHIRACLHEQRSRLVKLVCNGKTMFDASSFFVSTPPYFTPPKELS